MAAQKPVVILGVFVADTAYRAARAPRMGETILGSGFKLGPGGKGSNQAVAAGRLGADVTFVTRLGRDPFADMARATWKDAGVKPAEIPPVQKEVQKVIDKAEGKSWPMISIERYAFYERAKQAYCVIQSGERRFYGCFAFRKGVVGPDAE